jgi:hypothetical protein
MGEKLPTYVVEVGLKEVQDDTSVDAVAARRVARHAEVPLPLWLIPGIRSTRTCSSTRTRCPDAQETPGAGAAAGGEGGAGDRQGSVRHNNTRTRI